MGGVERKTRKKTGGSSLGFSVGLILAGVFFSACSSTDEELLREYRSYYHGIPKEHPARFVVNQTAGKAPSASYRLQFGIDGDRDLDSVREQMRSEIARIQKGIRWKEKRKTVKLEIGGDAVEFSGEYPLDSTERESPESKWSIRCDPETIVVTADFPDSAYVPNNRMLYRGDALEIFLCTDYEAKLYREIIVNADGRIFTALHANDRFGSFQCLIPDGREKYGITVKGRVRKKDFHLEVTVPWNCLPEYRRGGRPRAGEVLDFMLVRTHCDRPGGEVRMTTPVPLLYDGHNVFGYIRAVLQKRTLPEK